MNTSASISHGPSRVQAPLRTFFALLISTILLGGISSLPAETQKHGSGVHAQIRHVFAHDGRLVTIPDNTAAQPARRVISRPVDETIDEPEFVWNRATHTWIKNHRFGTAKILAQASLQPEGKSARRGS